MSFLYKQLIVITCVTSKNLVIYKFCISLSFSALSAQSQTKNYVFFNLWSNDHTSISNNDSFLLNFIHNQCLKKRCYITCVTLTCVTLQMRNFIFNITATFLDISICYKKPMKLHMLKWYLKTITHFFNHWLIQIFNFANDLTFYLIFHEISPYSF